MNLVELKRSLRVEYRQKRNQLSSAFRDSAQTLISNKLKNLLEELNCKTVGAYMGFESEVVLTELFSSVVLEWCFPKVEVDHLQFYKNQNFSEFETSTWGVSEPPVVASQAIAIQDLDAVLVPGLVFDAGGNRIGYGKGYYDRALADFSGPKIGIGFKEQMSLQHMIATEAHDLTMDFIVTEGFIYSPRARGN